MPERLITLAALIALMCSAFLVRLFQLQVLEGSQHAQAVERALVVIEPLASRRGRILDRTGTPMTETKPLYHAAVVLAELEIEGRARRDQDLWRLDGRRFDALVGDLTSRLRWVNRQQSLREVLEAEFLACPGTALRLGRRADPSPLALVSVERKVLGAATGESEEPARQLVEGDLLWEDPRDAIVQEMAARWKLDADLPSEAQWQAACAALDRELDLGGEHSASVLEPFAERCHLDITGVGPMDLRVLISERREQAELTLARVTGQEVEVVRERLARALAANRPQPPKSGFYYAASASAEAVAPLLPTRANLGEIPLPQVPGARERVLILQGDPPDDEGLLSQLCRRLSATLGGVDVALLQAVIENHAERIKPVTSGRDHRIHHLVLDPVKVSRLVAGLAKRLNLPATEVERRLGEARRLADREQAGRTRRDPIPLFREVPTPVAMRLCGTGSQPPDSLRRQFETSDATLPGLTILTDVGRSYPFPKSAGHILGMLGRGGPEGPESLRGLTGLEWRYDDVLRGIMGARVRARTPDGFINLRETAPLSGTDLVTEVDIELQMLAEDSLERYIELAHELDPGMGIEEMQRAAKVGRGRAGLAIIDCRTGGILVLASTPTFAIEDARNHYSEMAQDPAQPLIDHASVAEQPPGSSFKILTALCALENGVMVPGEQVWCQGYMAKSGAKFILRDHAPAGVYDLAEAIQMSSNVYFATMADRLAKRLGPAVLPAYAERVGLGRINSLDVTSQRVGPMALPTPDNIGRLRPKEPRWYPNDSWRMGIGQNCQAAPLNVAPIAAAVANGGHVVRPFLVRPDSGPVVTDLNIKEAYLRDVQKGMERVTANLPHSTAKRLVLEGDATGIKVAAKTGTAEWGSPDSRASGRTPDHAWLIGYAPADNPTVAFAVFINCGTFGGKACVAPIKRVLERYFAKYGHDGHPPAGTALP